MPQRKWDNVKKQYSEILIIPAGTKHDSGYMHIAIIGVFIDGEKKKYEICAFPDDICCLFPIIKLGDKNQFEFARVHMDCLYPIGVLRYHSVDGYFTVSAALSSVNIIFHNDK